MIDKLIVLDKSSRSYTVTNNFSGGLQWNPMNVYMDIFDKVPAPLHTGYWGGCHLGKSLMDSDNYTFNKLVVNNELEDNSEEGFLIETNLKIVFGYYQKKSELRTDFSIENIYVDSEYYNDANYQEAIDKYIARIKSEFKKDNVDKPKMKVIIPSQGGLTTESVDLDDSIKMDIDKFYNDDFKEIHNIIIDRLNKPSDKGLVLLHGKVGSGKTSYLRYLTTQVKDKCVIFLPGSLASQLASPDILSLFLENKNSILVIEDAEDLLMDRGVNYNKEGVSNLLNVADGLLSDVLNIQIICTFNCDIAQVDKALLRKGRLIAKYEFDNLSVDKSNVLLKEIGKEYRTNEPMTLTNIFNVDDKAFVNMERPKIGFNR